MKLSGRFADLLLESASYALSIDSQTRGVADTGLWLLFLFGRRHRHSGTWQHSDFLTARSRERYRVSPFSKTFVAARPKSRLADGELVGQLCVVP